MHGSLWWTYPVEEHGEALFDDGFDDHAVDVSKPDRHHGAHDEQQRQYEDVPGFATVPARDHNGYQLV